MDWLWTVLYGFVAGLAEFLPLSSPAHQSISVAIFGLTEAAPLRQFLIRTACLAGLISSCGTQINKLRRDGHLAKQPARRRKRPVDSRSIATIRLLNTAVFPLIIGLAFYRRATMWVDSLAMVTIFLLINGILLFLPQYIPSGNKDGRTLTRLDSLLIGLSGALSVFPGISRMSAIHFAASARGADKNYALQFALYLSVPALIVMLIFDAVAIFAGIEALSFVVILQYLLAMAAAYFGSTFAISVMRSLAARTGYAGFAFYCWGMALISMILYLTT